MPFVDAKCPNCGGELMLDNRLESGYCNHCGSPVKYEQAINLLKLEKDANIVGFQSFEEKVHNAQQLLEFDEYEKAYSIFDELSKSYATNYQVWLGLFDAKTQNRKIISSQFLVYLDRALTCAKKDSGIHNIVKTIYDDYSGKLKQKEIEQTRLAEEQRKREEEKQRGAQETRRVSGINNKIQEYESRNKVLNNEINSLKRKLNDLEGNRTDNIIKIVGVSLGHLALLAGLGVDLYFIKDASTQGFAGILAIIVFMLAPLALIIFLWVKLIKFMIEHPFVNYKGMIDSETVSIESKQKTINSNLREIEILKKQI